MGNFIVVTDTYDYVAHHNRLIARRTPVKIIPRNVATTGILPEGFEETKATERKTRASILVEHNCEADWFESVRGNDH